MIQPTKHRIDRRAAAVLLTLLLVVGGGALIAQYDRILDAMRSLRTRGHAAMALRGETEGRFRQGVAMLHARRYNDAATAFHRVLELSPRMPEAHVNMGFALVGLQQWQAAHDFFATAIELNPEQANAYYGLAVALEALGDLPGALGAMRTYTHRTRPDDPYVKKAQAAIWEWQATLNQTSPTNAAQAGERGSAESPTQ